MSDRSDTKSSGSYEAKPTRKRGCLGHLKRFWWAYLLALICIVVLAVCLILFVAIPHIAQGKVNKSKLEVQGVHMIQTQTNSFKMEINSTIATDGSIKADVDPFDGVMYLEDVPDHRPFVSIRFPKTNANKHQVINISQEVQITDRDAFSRFNVWFANNQTLKVTLEGRTKVKPSGLAKKYRVTFKKTILMNGLNFFKGTQVTAGEILLEPKNGRNFQGTVNIPNTSYFTLDIGNASFINFIDDKNVGSLFIDNLLLRPGNNSVPVTANLNQSDVITALASPKYCKTGIIPVKLLGDNVIDRGQKLEYFLDALASNNQTINMDIGGIIKKSLGTTIGCAS